MKNTPTVGEILRAKGVSRRGFLKYCATTASLLALPPTMIPRIAKGDREREATLGDLAVLPGVHRLHRVADALGVTDGRGTDLRRDLARLPPHAAGRVRRRRPKPRAMPRWKRTKATTSSSSTARSRWVIPATRRSRASERRHAQGDGRWAPPRSFRSAPARRSAASRAPIRTRRAPSRSGPRQGQADHQRARLPADPDGHDRGTDAVPDLRPAARGRQVRPTAGVLRSDDSRPLLPPAVLRAGQVRRDLRRRRREGGLVPLQTRLQGPDDLQRLRDREVEPGHELPDRVRAIRASAARSRISGTRAASTSRCRRASSAAAHSWPPPPRPVPPWVPSPPPLAGARPQAKTTKEG